MDNQTLDYSNAAPPDIFRLIDESKAALAVTDQQIAKIDADNEAVQHDSLSQILGSSTVTNVDQIDAALNKATYNDPFSAGVFQLLSEPTKFISTLTDNVKENLPDGPTIEKYLLIAAIAGGIIIVLQVTK